MNPTDIAQWISIAILWYMVFRFINNQNEGFKLQRALLELVRIIVNKEKYYD